MPKISVILPVYNVEPYLRQCLDSVVNQTFTDLEIIPVDDGSPDNCGEIIDQYANSDSRVRPIHQENGGYGKAINAGLAVARGDYIAIVETDDWIEPDMFERLHSAAVASGANIVKATFNKIHVDGRVNDCSFAHVSRGIDGFVSTADSLELMLYESSIWSALYRREFLSSNGIRMLETQGASYQDVVWKFMTYAMAREIYLLNGPVYNYRVFAVGSSSASSDKALAMFHNYATIREFLVANGTFSTYAASFYVHQIFDCVFHVNRLNGAGLALFYESARKMISEAEGDGVFIEEIEFDPNVNDYVVKEVLPLYRAIRSGNVRFQNIKKSIKNFIKAHFGYLIRLFR